MKGSRGQAFYRIVPLNPIYGLIVATTRVNCLGWPSTRAERREMLKIEDAIRHYTIGSARTMFWDGQIGSIEVGKYADLALFSIDLTGLNGEDVDADALAEALGGGGAIFDNLVEMTMVDGRLVYQRSDAAAHSGR